MARFDESFDTRKPRDVAVDVIVIGAGPVGLSLAIELGLRGVRALVVEQQTERGLQPRAKTHNMRSMTHYRRWGIANAIRAAFPGPVGLKTDVVFQTRLFGKHIATVPNIYFRGADCENDPRFPEQSEWTPQYIVEDSLRAKVQSLRCVKLEYGLAFEAYSEQQDVVSVRLRDVDGREREVDARYLVGADGARSGVRAAMGAEMFGRYAFAANLNIMLRIPELTRSPPSSCGMMHWILNEDSPCVLGPVGDLWYLVKQLEPGANDVSLEEIGELLVSAVGRAVEFEVVKVDPWYAHELIANSYRNGRVFLAGDACHLHPPFGGYGMNMGVSDAVDLGWKLSAVLQNWGGEGLLDSYEFERKRVHRWTIDEAVANYATLSQQLIRPGLEDDSVEGDAIRLEVGKEVLEKKQREFHTIGLVLGYHYSGSEVIAIEEQVPAISTTDYSPQALCGLLAPHIWLASGQSIYDQFGSGFTLVNRGSAANAFIEIAEALGVPLTVLELAHPRAADLYPSMLTLVRPDQHVAWRGDDISLEQARAVLRTVTGRRGLD